jgi:long-chain acyl-CoA synthetase
MGDMTNLAAALNASATRYPDHVAVRLDDYHLTYAGLADASARVASLLREQGFAPGDRVGVMLPKVPQFALIYYGVLRAGGVVVPMNPLLKSREVEYYLSDSGASHLFAWHQMEAALPAGVHCQTVKPAAFDEMLARLAPAPGTVARQGQDTAVILYTSGTTGQPKGPS